VTRLWQGADDWAIADAAAAAAFVFIVVVVTAATAATESNGCIAMRGRRTSAGANNASSPPVIRAMPLLLLLGAILALSLASLESGRRSARGEGPRPQTRCCGGLLLPPLEREVDDGNYDEVAAGGTPAAIGTWAKAEQHRQYFLMLERAPGYFWVEFFVRESKRFMVEQNLILFYPWCYYATQKYPFMRRGICRTYVRNGTKMYGNRNYYRPPLDEASKIIWKILLR